MREFTLSHITAVSKNHVIGYQNKLPWHLPEDLQFFQNKTKGRVVIMGRKTFESLGKPLEDRVNIVITRNKNFKPSGVVLARNIQEAILISKKYSQHEEIFITGGAEIYKQSMGMIKRIYLTRIHQDFKGDAFYPEVDEQLFKLVKKEDKKGPPPFSFLVYERAAP